MTDREKLIEILRATIFPHELVDPLEAVADYLLDNDVVPVVRCKDCKDASVYEHEVFCGLIGAYLGLNDFCSHGERRAADD